MNTPSRARGTDSAPGGNTPSRARPGEVGPDERARLRASFGRALWGARAQAGLSQAALCAAAGVGPRQVAKLEAGAVRPSDAMCRRLAAVLRASCDDVTRAELALELMAAAGGSLRIWRRRRPLRRRVQLAEAAAAERLRSRAEAAAERERAEALELWTLLNEVPPPAPSRQNPTLLPSGRRVQIRRRSA